MIVNVEEENEPFIDERLELLDLDGFMDSCSSLVTTFWGCEDSNSRHDVYVKLAHFSVKEFLVSDAIRTGSCSDFALEKELAHSCLAKSCLVYFQQITRPVSSEVRSLHSFASYAGSFWLEHKRLAKQNWTSGILQEMLLNIFDDNKVYYRNWLKLSAIDKPWLQTASEEQADYTPLYCAAYNGFADVSNSLLAKGAKPDASCGLYGNALQAAASNGHLLTTKILLKAGADINAKGGRYGSAISGAAAGGHEEVVKELLAAGATVQPSRRSFGDRRTDPLFLAVVNGHRSVCDLLLSHGAEDFYTMKARPCSALHAATQNGRIDIVRSLLTQEQSRKQNSHEAGCPSVIRRAASGIAASQHSAAARGQVEILRELLTYGISEGEVLRYAARAGDEDLVLNSLREGVDLEGTGGGSDHPRALQSAALGGHVSVVRELLSHGSDPNLDTDFSSALSAAVAGGSLEIAQMLVDAGANVNPQNSKPLAAAIYAGRRDFVKFFVQHGADTHRSLRGAVIEGNAKTFRLLLKLGANVHLQSPDDATSILQAAAFGGSAPIVRYLMENKVRPDSDPGYTETSPLTEAIRCRHWQVVELLLDNGADVNAAPPADSEPPPAGGTYYNGNLWPPQPACETPLSMAIKNQNQEIARTLMDRGALTTPKTPTTTGTPLLYAVWEDMIDLVKELLDRGADSNQRGTILRRGKSTFPLLIAAEKGNADIISVLINAGARVNEQDSEGFSALHAAAAYRDPKILKKLIHEHHADINLCLLNGSRPIHSAASRGTAEHVRIILDAGASIDSKNESGRTPLHWAADGMNWDVVELLLEKKANPNLKTDEAGITPLDMAHLARKMPHWKRRQNETKGTAQWDDEKVEKLLLRLNQSMKQIS